VPDAWNSALRLLGRREFSEAELGDRLRRKGFGEDDIAAALERCRRYGYVDDERFARLRARRLLTDGRAVGPALLADLKRHRLSEDLARAAMTELAEEFNETDVLHRLCRRRFPDFDFETADERRRRRVFNYLRRRGFSAAVLFQYFREER
jgi:regulatory protein